MEKDRTKIDLFVLFALSSLILFWRLGSGSLTSWDEGLYGGVSIELLKTGNWLDLRWAGQPWSDKPPLYMWMTVIFYKLFGVNELAVRLFSAICGVGTVLATYLLAKRIYSRNVALASSLVLLTTWHFIWSSRVGMLDMPLTFFTTAAFLSFKTGETKKIWLFFTPLVFALAFLTKGMASTVIPVTLALYVLAAGKFNVVKEKVFLWGILAAFLILGFWHWAAFSHYGDKFIQDYFLKHILTRTTTAMDGHTGNIFTYFGVIPNKGRSWGSVGLFLMPYLAWLLFVKKEKEHALPLLWAAVVLSLFSPIKTKLHWYIMPVYPALSIMTGWAVIKLFKKYGVMIVASLAAVSLVYLAADKGIFNLDYSPSIKSTAQTVKKSLAPGEKVFLYGVGDPGMQFYLGLDSENVSSEENLKILLGQKGKTLLTGRGNMNIVSGPGRSVIFENGDFVLLKTE